jgi:hypothetical protein
VAQSELTCDLQGAKWLLIFDNVESHQIFENYWPAVDRGSILITTRRHMIASQPIERGLPILHFSVDEGAKFILYLLQKPQGTPDGEDAAHELSSLLNGYALAVSQMTAFMNTRTMPVREFLELYKKYPRRLHKERKEGWKFIEYDYAIDTVWDISFDALDAPATALLRVLSFCAPDSIPIDILEPREIDELLSSLEFCDDEFEY